MKRKFMVLMVCLVCIVLMTACQCRHEWVAADCTTPKTCLRCDETIGEPLGHAWLVPTCTTAQTCSACGRTEGVYAEHQWISATCSSPAICSVCNASGGSAAGHQWADTINEKGMPGRLCMQCQAYEEAAHDATPLTACEQILVSNEDAHEQDLVVGNWDTRAGRLPDSIRFCVSNKKSYRNTHHCTYRLRGNYTTLSGLVSFSPKSEQFATAKIQIYLDNELAFESGTISDTSKDEAFTLDVREVQLVRIVCSTPDMPSAYCVVSASVY